MNSPQSHEATKEKKLFEPITEHEEYEGRNIVDAAYSLHTGLGPGLLERVYEVCLCHELSKRLLIL